MKIFMHGLMPIVIAAITLGGAVPPAMADGSVIGKTVIEDFTMQPETRWRFFTDQVMGGMSSGGVAFAQEDGTPFARMTGHVSTANRGGFIQLRLDQRWSWFFDQLSAATSYSIGFMSGGSFQVRVLSIKGLCRGQQAMR